MLLKKKVLFNRTMILDIHRLKTAGLLQGDTPEQQYRYYQDVILNTLEHFQALYEEFPELKRLSSLDGYQQESLEREIRENLERDREQITAQFCDNQSFQKITEIDFSAGDAHNGGRRTAKVVLDNGVTVYYKPHSIRKAQWYQELYGYLCRRSGIGYKRVKYICGENYGWEEKTENKECNTREEIQRYYFRLGIHLCIGYVLSATDLHGENIIAHGEYPVIVDFETFPGYHIKTEESSAERKSETILSHSVIHTGMLPILTWGRRTGCTDECSRK